MSKSSFLNNKKLDKSNIALICILGMLVGFLISRVALSISLFLFGINAIRDINPRLWFKQKWWLLGICWIAIYALTYFWTSDMDHFHTRLEVKLPFLLLPLAFAFLPAFSRKHIQIFTVSISVILVAVSVYSVSFFLRDPTYYLLQYQVSHVLPTLPKDDHIRASLAIVLFMIWCIYAWPFLEGRPVKWIVGISLFLLAAYIHILAVKSGLVSLYLFIIGWSIYLAFAKKKIIALLIIIAIPLFLLFSIKYIPTFRERARYIDYSYYMYKNGDTSGNYGDISRLISYKLSYRIIRQHPLIGVGIGDLLTEMNKQYDQYYPLTPKDGRLLPHNQFLVVALGCGIPAMLLFTWWVFMPLTWIRKNRQSFFFFMVWLILFIQLMIEPVLEVQFGVFVYLFFLLLQKHELPGSDIQEAQAQNL